MQSAFPSGLSAEASLQDLAAKLGIPSVPSPKGAMEAGSTMPANMAAKPEIKALPFNLPESLPPAQAFELMNSSVLAYPSKADLEQQRTPARPPVMKSLSSPIAASAQAAPHGLQGLNLLPQTPPNNNAQSQLMSSQPSQVTDAWLQVAYQMLKNKNASSTAPAQQPLPQQPAQPSTMPVQVPSGLPLPIQQNAGNQLNSLQALQTLLRSQGALAAGSFSASKFPLMGGASDGSDLQAVKKQRIGDGLESSAQATSVDSPSPCEAGDVHGMPKRIKRVRSQTLNAQQAKEIYRMRPSELPPGAAAVGHTAELAAKFHVATNTIRDIWNRRSWAKATLPLWTPKEVQDYRDTYAHTGVSLLWLDAYRAEGKE